MEVSEAWKPAPGYEGLYEVSSLGQVYTIRRPRVKGGLLRPCINDWGYPCVNLYRDRRRQHWKVHQLVMLAFVGPCPPGQEIRHLDGNPANNRWAPGTSKEEVRAAGGNLIYGTHSENMIDQIGHDTHHLGRRTRCDYGHEFTEENTAIDLRPDGTFKKRRCLTCTRENSAKQRARMAASDVRCSEEGCDKPIESCGFCHTHRERQRRAARKAATESGEAAA